MRLLAHAGLFVLVASTQLALACDDLTTLADALRARTLDWDHAVAVERLQLALAPGVLQIERGVLVPAPPLAGKSAEFVFTGEARFRLAAPNKVERQQLLVHIGQDPLDVVVDRFVLAIADDGAADRLLASKPLSTVDPLVKRTAERSFKQWNDSTERRVLGVDLALIRDACGDAEQEEFFAVLVHSPGVGSCFLAFQPNEVEQISAGRYSPPRIGDMDTYRAEKRLRQARHRGRFLNLRVEDLGNWDTWVSHSARKADGTVIEGGASFEPDHYLVDVTLDAPELRLRGRVRIDLKATASGSRVVDLDIFPDLKVDRVTDGDGQPLDWWQDEGDVVVFLPEPIEAGQPAHVVVEYHGSVLDRIEYDWFRPNSTHHWYPHAGTIDRATYDVTLRWPRRHEVLAAGRRTDGGRDGDQLWERRELNVAASGFSFEIGEFKVREFDVGHISVRLGVTKTGISYDARAGQELTDAIERSLWRYEEAFGPYPLDHLTVVTSTRESPESALGLVALPWSIMRDYATYGRTRAVAHALASQWWGGKVGWFGYREEWLREALSRYGEALVFGSTLGKDVILTRNDAWMELLQWAEDEENVNRFGPVALGYRLNSNLGSRAYYTAFAGRGQIVFNMLVREIGAGPFLKMLGAISEAASGHVLRTGSFLDAIERMSGKNLRDFEDRFVDGTGVPTLICDYATVPIETGWRVRGEVHVLDPRIPFYRLDRLDPGGWDVIVDPRTDTDTDSLRLDLRSIVRGIEPSGSDQVPTVLEDTITIDGLVTMFEIDTDWQPVAFELDPGRRAVVRLLDGSRPNRRYALTRAVLMARAGRLDEAETMLREALIADAGPSAAKRRRAETEKIDAANTYLRLAELLMDLGRDTEAHEALRQGVKAYPAASRGWIMVPRAQLEARLALRAGDYKRAFDQLKKILYLEFLQRADDSVGAALRRVRWNTGEIGNGRDYAMLAIAAHHTGHEEVCERAGEEASRRRADMAPLAALHERSSAD